MQEGLKDKVLKIFAVILMLAILIVGSIMAWPAYRRSRALRQRDAELAARIEKKRLEIEELKNFQQRYRTDSDFVEAIARKNRRVFPGELVFLFEDE